jgi:glyoxylate reductase
MEVLITRKLPEIAEKILQQKGFKVLVHKKDSPIERSELLKKSKYADAVIPLLTDSIDKEFIDNLNKCKIIANYAVGYNNIDVKYANSKNIIVTNTPEILTDATADLTMALILSCTRRIVESVKFLREGKYLGWKPMLLMGMQLKSKTLGIIGAGRIGQETAKRASGFGLKIIYFDKIKRPEIEKSLGAKKVSLNRLLKVSDIISIHTPLNEATFHLLNKDNLKSVKRGVVIVNTARGEIIDEIPLIQLLKSGHIFSAGLDVYENEPKINKKLLRLPNVVLLPHIGSATIETRSKMAELCAKNVVNVLSGKKPLTEVTV